MVSFWNWPSNPNQILDKTIRISHSSNTLEKGKHLIILLPTKGKEKHRVSYLSFIWQLKENWIQTFKTLLKKLTLSSYAVGKYLYTLVFGFWHIKGVKAWGMASGGQRNSPVPKCTWWDLRQGETWPAECDTTTGEVRQKMPSVPGAFRQDLNNHTKMPHLDQLHSVVIYMCTSM